MTVTKTVDLGCRTNPLLLKARYIETPKIGMLGKGFAPVHADR